MVNVWAKPDGTWQTFQPQIQTFAIDRLLTNVKIQTISQDYRQPFAQNPSKRLEAITNSCVVRLNDRHELTGRVRHKCFRFL
jgi:hypothetical protein